MTMEIHQLRYFVAVAEEGSFSSAAEREQSRNLLSVSKSISWKRNRRLRSATARQETNSCSIDGRARHARLISGRFEFVRPGHRIHATRGAIRASGLPTSSPRRIISNV